MSGLVGRVLKKSYRGMLYEENLKAMNPRGFLGIIWDFLGFFGIIWDFLGFFWNFLGIFSLKVYGIFSELFTPRMNRALSYKTSMEQKTITYKKACKEYKSY